MSTKASEDKHSQRQYVYTSKGYSKDIQVQEENKVITHYTLYFTKLLIEFIHVQGQNVINGLLNFRARSVDCANADKDVSDVCLL